MNLLINYSVYRKLFLIEDSKIYQKIWALQKNCPILILYNELYLIPGQFMVSVCPLKKKTKLDPADIRVFLHEQGQQREALFRDQMQVYYIRLVQWITKMNSDSLKDSDKMYNDKNFMKERASLIVAGIQLAIEIKRSLKSCMLLFKVNDATVPKKMFAHIIQAVEMLKAIEIEFRTKKFLINKWVVLINRYTCELITQLIEQGMKKVYEMKRGIAQDNMSQLMMTIIESYKGGYNALRKTVIAHCLNLVSHDVFSSKEVE